MPTTQLSNKEINYSGRVLQIAVPSPLRRIFDYLPLLDGSEHQAQEYFAGCRVRISFGRQQLVGIIVKVCDGSSLSKSKLKPVIALLDTAPLFSPKIFKTLLWAANYYQHPLGEVLSTALPARLRAGRPLKPTITVWQIFHPVTEEQRASLKRAKKQLQLLEFIEGHSQNKGRPTQEECLLAGFSQTIISQLQKKNLIEKQLLIPSKHEAFVPLTETNTKHLDLNQEQKIAVEQINAKPNAYSCYLLDGVTGSGKTEVYMRAIDLQLSLGKQCLILVPEIGLTPQTVSRFERRFDRPVVSLHSGLNDGERLRAWDLARDGQAAIIIGTRSAIFTPMAKPGLIVVDEEHDSSFKQQEGFRYSARDLAVIRGREEKLTVILGSATPSLESLYNAEIKKFKYLQLSKRAGNAEPAAMEITDISNEQLEDGFSEQLLYKIQRHIKQQGQVLVFINRRGFAPILNCQSCGWVSECDNCVAQLTVHAHPAGLRCHHCGSTKQLPRYCPSCKSANLSTMGIGTQKIEKFLNRKFSSIPIIRIDRDSTRGKNKLAEMLEIINKGEPCILLGTQMLAKGHHFPNITLVAILDADAGLFSADFRGQEQMAQTILQVAGRAGRAERRGEVLIQSRHSSHVTLQTITHRPYADLAKILFAERELSSMPPYSHLCLVRAEAADIKIAINFLRQVASISGEICEANKFNVERQGPLPAPMEKRAGRFRIQLLLKSQNRGDLQDLLSLLLQQIDTLKLPNKLRWSVDVDPQDLI